MRNRIIFSILKVFEKMRESKSKRVYYIAMIGEHILGLRLYGGTKVSAINRSFNYFLQGGQWE